MPNFQTQPRTICTYVVNMLCEKMRIGGAVCAPLAIVAPFWQENGTPPNLLQSGHFQEHLHIDLVMQSRTCGRGLGRFVPLATPSRPDVVANTGNAIPATSACFQAGPSLRYGRGKRYLMNRNRGQFMVRVGSGGPKCCTTAASPDRTAQRSSSPRPNPYRGCGAFLCMLGRSSSEFGAVCDIWSALLEHDILFSIPFHPPQRFLLQGHSEPEKVKVSKDVLGSRNGGLAAK